MSNAFIKGSPRQLIASFTSTLGVGSSYNSSAINISNYKSFVGICNAGSSDMTLRCQQSALSATMHVNSTIAFTPGATTFDWTAYGQYAKFGISAVNSTQGEVVNFHVYGVPI